MKSILAAACLSVLAAAPLAAEPAGRGAESGARSTVFAELEGLGFDLGRFRPDSPGRPYR